MKKILIGLLVSLMLVGCGNSNTEFEQIEYTETELKYTEVDMSIYPGMQVTGHAFKKVRMGEANKLYSEGGTGVVYYGYSDCPFCRKAVSVINDVATKMNVNVYYVDVFQEYDGKDDDFDNLLELTKDHLQEVDGEVSFFVPQLFVVKDGEIVGEHLSLTDDYESGDLTHEQYNELANIYANCFRKLVG